MYFRARKYQGPDLGTSSQHRVSDFSNGQWNSYMPHASTTALTKMSSLPSSPDFPYQVLAAYIAVGTLAVSRRWLRLPIGLVD